jgi:hypothetical protein
MDDDRFSQISATDRITFFNLSNPYTIDFDSIPDVHEDETSARIEDITPTTVPTQREVVAEPQREEVRTERTEQREEEVRTEQREEARAEVRTENAIPEVRREQDAIPEVRHEPPYLDTTQTNVNACAPSAPKLERIEETNAERREAVRPEKSREDLDFEKRSVIMDLTNLENTQNIKLTKEWTMEDSLEDMTLELKRHLLQIEEKNNVSMMKSGIRILLTGIEIVNVKYNVLDLEGWSTQAIRELDAHDANLARIHRKYWKKTTSSPEMSIAFSLVSSMAFYHVKRSMNKQVIGKGSIGNLFAKKKKNVPISPDTSDDEEIPPSGK